ncbi:SGNH/GDSL hydrolase family protein [Rhizobium sp. G187]|uniref:SGNH/GDSL hydrolase family protein n=1 Tax=Rhizobium sp. G187 TaxID=3451352 RepID=UPI003EE67F1F
MHSKAMQTARRACALLLGLLIALSTLIPAAEAQQPERRRTLMDLFFGDRQPRYQPAPPPRDVRRSQRQAEPRARTNRSVTTIKTRQPAARAEVKPPPPAKLETAKKVLVIGDFVAGGLGDGLKIAFEDSPGVVVETRSNGSSGLVRADYHDWAGELPRLIEEIKPTVVVIQIGANDRQQMVTDTGRLEFRTEEWFAAYAARATALGQIATQARIPLVWVGLTAFQSPSMTADTLRLNTIYQTTAEKLGGEFVDVWDGFVDQDGRFIVTGSDINGQPVRLRGSDGINFTASGKRKLAFYAEKPLRRLLGDMTSPDLVRLDASNLPNLTTLAPTETRQAMTTPPIDLFDPELDGATELLGASTKPVRSAFSTPREQLVETGKLPDPPPGRVDYVRLPAASTPQGQTATP